MATCVGPVAVGASGLQDCCGDKPKLLVCRGKCCVKRGAYAKLLADVADVADVQLVRCQKICKGPVVGTEIGGELERFRRVRGPKSRRAVVRLLRDGKLQRRLLRRRVRGRSGQLR